jgi:hypothetical protein
MSFAEARAAALAAFLKRHEPREPSSQDEDTWERYNVRCKAFAAAAKVLANPLADSKLTIDLVVNEVLQDGWVDYEVLWRYLNKWFKNPPISNHARLQAAWSVFRAKHRINPRRPWTQVQREEWHAIRDATITQGQLDLFGRS